MMIKRIVVFILSVGLCAPVAQAGITATGDVDPPDPANWTTQSNAYIGKTGVGSVSVDDDSDLVSGLSYLGYRPGSTGAATVSGAGSSWTTFQLLVGDYGDGTLNIGDGGLVVVHHITRVGDEDGSTGAITFDNGTLTTSEFQGAVADLSGTGTINTRGLVSDVDLVFDATHGRVQTLTLNGPGQNITVNLDVGVGAMGAGYRGKGSMHISDGVSVPSMGGYLGFASGSSGRATVSGADSTWTIRTDLYIGLDGDGTLDITGGAAVTNRYGRIGTNSNSTGAVTVSGAGSTWTNREDLRVGDDGEGTLSIADGGLVSVAGGMWIGYGRSGVDGSVNIGTAGELLVTDDVNLADAGVLDVGGVLAADEINVKGGLLTNRDNGSVGTARLAVSSGVVNATQPVTITEKLTIGSQPVINVTNGLFSVKGHDLLNDPARELTFQGGEVGIDSGGLAIDMPGTDIIVVDDTVLDLGAATSATFDELVFGAGSTLTIESDSPVSLFFGGISGEGGLDGSLSDVTITGLLSPGETGRVLTIQRDAAADDVAGYVAMLEALGHTAEAEDVAMACLDGDSYPVISAVPEPATLSLLLIGGLLAGARRWRGT